MLKCLAVICGLLATSSASANTWSLDPQFRDPKTTEVGPAASATNTDGYTVTIARAKDRRVYIVLKLPENSFDRLSLKGRIAALRPDQKTVAFIEVSNSLAGMEQPFTLPGEVRSRLWHGQDDAPLAGTLRNILDSSKLTVRFFTDAGTTVDTVFDLVGAPPVIAKALGIPETVAPEATENAVAARRIKSEATRRCYLPSAAASDSKACMDAVERCGQNDEATFNAVTYRACLKKSKWHADLAQ